MFCIKDTLYSLCTKVYVKTETAEFICLEFESK